MLAQRDRQRVVRGQPHVAGWLAGPRRADCASSERCSLPSIHPLPILLTRPHNLRTERTLSRRRDRLNHKHSPRNGLHSNSHSRYNHIPLTNTHQHRSTCPPFPSLIYIQTEFSMTHILSIGEVIYAEKQVMCSPTNLLLVLPRPSPPPLWEEVEAYHFCIAL